MAHKLEKKYLKLGTGSGELNASDLDANFGSPDNYTPADTSINGHLQGVDGKLALVLGNTTDIKDSAFTISNNVVAATDVTDLLFANAAVRGAKIEYSITINATASLFEKGELEVVQRGAGWQLTRESTGDDSLINFSITNSGQIQYTSSNYAGFTSGKIQFRAFTNGI